MSDFTIGGAQRVMRYAVLETSRSKLAGGGRPTQPTPVEDSLLFRRV